MPPQDIVKTFKDLFYQTTHIQVPQSPYTKLVDVGLDSLDAVELIMAFEKKFKLKFRNFVEYKIDQYSTFADLFKTFVDTLVAHNQLNPVVAQAALSMYAPLGYAAPLANADEPVVIIPRSLLNECIRALANKKALVTKLKQYQK